MKEPPTFTDQGSHLEKPLHDQIAAAAYRLYLENGRQDGRDWEHWFRAEELLRRQAARPARDQVQPNAPQEVRPLDPREYPFARDKRGSAKREEIRQRALPMHPAARQTRRQPERSSQAR